ncbi:MAG: sigma factor-binding protein Crl [Vibrio gallaecicus]|uniref:sigma factor-binding protein Crl n=1 Tax=Vibrio TaxID=662 RepID=UPI0010C9B162|nr:sigma factor-binding protein Crl [Vibrio gallaecicus]MDN3614983.1 sigma factor-binding protein Crl [Vibrio gallaecicus]
MSEVTKKPTHYRLLTALKAIGPYLREPQSEDGHYIFDCLSVCVSDKKSPEEREFWGWWLELNRSEDGFTAKYNIGRYNVAGDWDSQALPKKAVAEVSRTQEAFHQKLVDELSKKFEINVQLDEESVEFV